jgi:hypothetical protein
LASSTRISRALTFVAPYEFALAMISGPVAKLGGVVMHYGTGKEGKILNAIKGAFIITIVSEKDVLQIFHRKMLH